jgi:NAD-dependent SIR2 family protein deacetylase
MFFFKNPRIPAGPASDPAVIEPEDRHVVAVFGAGASMAAGGLGVADIFRKGFTSSFFARHSFWARTLRTFLRDVFGVRDCEFDSCETLPDIIMVLSLVDLAIEHGDALVGQNRDAKRRAWTHTDLLEIREKLEGLIIRTVLDPYFEQFDDQRRTIDTDRACRAFVHEIFLDYLYGKDRGFSLISMNYDMFVERAVMQHLEWLRSDSYSDSYTCPIYSVAFEQPLQHEPGIRVLHKLHGSCDWARCSGCGRITLLYTSHYLRERHLTCEKRTLEKFMKQLLGSNLASCERCGSLLRPVIIPPSLVKNYSNGHIRHIWSHAERQLTRCTDIYFVGYAMALEDLEFISMLKRHTQDVDRSRIHVITPDENAIWRYHSVFGRQIDVQLVRFEDWVAQNCPEIVGQYCDYRKSRAKALGKRAKGIERGSAPPGEPAFSAGA